MPSTDLESPVVQEARRAMEVCNACRYCEGFCAVFPAMELRREFYSGDLNYLANLCHSCRGCYYACQYAPPHEFGINVPKTLAELRQESYALYAWPGALAGAFQRNGLITALAMAGGIILLLLLGLVLQDPAVFFGAQPMQPGAGFYLIFPKAAMIIVASASFLFALLAMGLGLRAFWRDAGGVPVGSSSLGQAFRDAAGLRYLGGNGHGCNDVDGSFSTGRRHMHHALAYGFLLCFAATTVGAFDDLILGWQAPYPFFSLPVLLGTVGGIAMAIGAAGLFWLKLVGDQEPQARNLLGADAGLILLLLLIAVTGLTLLGLRGTAALGVVLSVHLGLVLAFFLTMPYSKFVHGLYRFGALLRHAAERPGA